MLNSSPDRAFVLWYRAWLVASALFLHLDVSPAAEPEGPEDSWRSEALLQRQKLLKQFGVDSWHQSGFAGKGIKIAVIDSGFQGYHDHLGKALPSRVMARSFRTDGALEAKPSQHGILCAEIVHFLAPEAELLFADWDVERADRFLAAVRWARAQGAQVVTSSIVTPHWSDGEGGGDVQRELAAILGDGTHLGDMLAFACAGNTVQRHWGGLFQDHGAGFHAWVPGQIDNGISPWSAEPVSVQLYWHSGADYQLVVYDDTTGKEVGHASTSRDQHQRSSAVLRFKPDVDHSYRARVRLTHGPGGFFHLTTMESSLEHRVARASVCFPADNERVVAVGAVDSEAHRVWYSACGPNSPRPKPDLMAPIPFATLIRERPFAGTSAAAPQAAALAAIWWSRHPQATAQQVRAALQNSARDLDKPGHDWETGYGLIRLPQE